MDLNFNSLTDCVSLLTESSPPAVYLRPLRLTPLFISLRPVKSSRFGGKHSWASGRSDQSGLVYLCLTSLGARTASEGRPSICSSDRKHSTVSVQRSIFHNKTGRTYWQVRTWTHFNSYWHHLEKSTNQRTPYLTASKKMSQWALTSGGPEYSNHLLQCRNTVNNTSKSNFTYKSMSSKMYLKYLKSKHSLCISMLYYYIKGSLLLMN